MGAKILPSSPNLVKTESDKHLQTLEGSSVQILVVKDSPILELTFRSCVFVRSQDNIIITESCPDKGPGKCLQSKQVSSLLLILCSCNFDYKSCSTVLSLSLATD